MLHSSPYTSLTVYFVYYFGDCVALPISVLIHCGAFYTPYVHACVESINQLIMNHESLIKEGTYLPCGREGIPYICVLVQGLRESLL